MFRSGLVDMLVTHANMKGFGQTPSFGDRRGFMPPQLKTKQTHCSLTDFQKENSINKWSIKIKDFFRKDFNQLWTARLSSVRVSHTSSCNDKSLVAA